MAGKNCCCGCCSVRDGTRIIAVLSILGALYGLFEYMQYLVALSNDPATIADAAVSSGSIDRRKREQVEQFFRDYQPGILVFFVGGTLLELFQLILSGLLLHGAWHDMESRCRPWYQYNYFLLVLSFFVVVILAVILMIYVSGILGFMLLAICCIPFGLQAYFLNVVNEYILELREGGGRGPAAGCVYSVANANSRVVV